MDKDVGRPFLRAAAVQMESALHLGEQFVT